LITLLVYTDAISPYSLFYSPLFLKKFEIWRIFTSFLYFGKPTLDVFMHIVFLYRYSRMLEEGCINTSEYFWLVSIISFILFIISNIYGIPTLGTSFSSTITYIWTKRNPRAIVQIFGFISFPAFYLPFILPGFMLLSRRSISIDHILGIVVGHIFYYFKDVYPRWGRNILGTPCWVKKMFNEHPTNCCKKEGITIGEGRARIIGEGRGMTIGEGRAKYERNKVQNNDTILSKDDEMNIEDKSINNNIIDEEICKDSSLFLNDQSGMTLKENLSISNTIIPNLESFNDTLNSNIITTIQDEIEDSNEENQSNDEWDEKWDIDSSEEGIKLIEIIH